ncbi:sigma-54 interaction domain-containing protein [Evansella cellulosilytica]|uniref:PAS modulated sigma54 specific transcriptional regulator, Fis family n=1 Tax=Evansella cellulosilytica (strain ATCC 21833 / DSM 2522 / FERM P-1141 / JCM 9156 / N-4) TaxID=649639 RepID=E6TXR6_EVAC2|nr:sigma-54-dependent Fis family transcriptional regulator [Evansella cellulosilytica]ADU29992.1 PAS modulated sigma54 specific transcriptional regulator, Fis family [Evansella cellulosilytica DSM 2522]
MKRLLLIGAGEGGSALLEILKQSKQFHIVGVVDKKLNSVGVEKAMLNHIETFQSWEQAYENLSPIDIIFDVTGNQQLLMELQNSFKEEQVTIIPSSVSSIIFELIKEKEVLIDEIINHNSLLDLIMNSTHDGMIAIDMDKRITLINRQAEKISSLKQSEVLGKSILEVMPSSQLPRVLKNKKTEKNNKQVIENGRTIITTRLPMFKGSKLIGALGVFKDITEITHMIEEVTNLKSIQQMLEAIIQSSNDAISVVDETGKGILINPAYTRLTGLTEREVIGKPASTDITEGESMHMKVLKTGEAVRGAKMKIGATKKDVIVNAAPVIVDGSIKGSVGVVHDMSEIEALNSELARAKQIIRTLEAKYSFKDIIGESEEIKIAIKQAKNAAITPASILLQGESGTGKELFAHAIHNESSRKYKKFIRVNCAAISESLLESELFGYEDGAFSGAKRGGKKGLFEEANGGSIFLDEIGEMSIHTQSKLLRVLQEKEIVRVGGTKPISIDVRIIAATNVDMEEKLEKKEFRNDLFYRLNRIPIHIPPLKNRKRDIPLLCQHLLVHLNQDYGRYVSGITDKALQILLQYDWYGNVRELENILGRAMIKMNYSEKFIDIQHLSFLEVKDKPVLHAQSSIYSNENKSLQEMLEETEKEVLIKTLEGNNGNKTKTAQQLKVSLRNLYYKLDKYSIGN